MLIEKLTKKQEKTLIPFREKWRKIGISTKRVDKKTTKEAITGLYNRLGLKLPQFIFCPSPFWCILQINFFKFLGVKSKGRNLWQNLQQNLRRNLGQNLRQNLWQNLGQNLRQNLEQNLWQNQDINKEFLVYHEFWAYGQMDSAWIGFYQFMEKIGIKYDDKDSELLEFWAKTTKSCSWFWTFENYVFISDRPIKLSFDNQYRLHNEHGIAYEYSDGWRGYYLHGVHFLEDLWRKIVSHEMPMEEILKIEDIDQRTQAIKFAKNGLRDFYQSQNGKKIDEAYKLDIKGRPVKYELWHVPKGQIFSQNVAFVIYDCPSSIERGEKQEYVSGVPIKFKIVAEAMAWKMSDDIDSMLGEEWQGLIPLKDEA